MAFKPRTESKDLKILRLLNTRMELTVEEKKYYSYLEKGYAGEVQFDSFTEKLQSECLILNDLLLEVNNSIFQVDTTIIFQDPIYIFEVKNYEGDFVYGPENFETLGGKIIKNPLIQLKRTKTSFQQLLQKLGYNIPIVAYVVFINPEFILYEAPINEPIIFPTQLSKFMQQLDRHPSMLNPRHRKLAEKLFSLQKMESPYCRQRAYEYDQLKKGFICKKCQSFTVSVNGIKMVCGDCGCEELVSAAVMRSVEDLLLLFPDLKITTKIVHDWCRVIDCKKRISRILDNNLNIIRSGQWAYYVKKDT